jgi:hypothetical protein
MGSMGSDQLWPILTVLAHIVRPDSLRETTGMRMDLPCYRTVNMFKVVVACRYEIRRG